MNSPQLSRTKSPAPTCREFFSSLAGGLSEDERAFVLAEAARSDGINALFARYNPSESLAEQLRRANLAPGTEADSNRFETLTKKMLTQDADK